MFSKILKKRKGKLPLPRSMFYENLSLGGSVLDIGCLGFREVNNAKLMGREDVKHYGVDYVAPDGGMLPKDFEFKQANLNEGNLPFADDSFDGIVASHVIEHLKDPISFVKECIRVCKPGGFVYVEAPSERSLLMPGMPFQHDMFYSLSFYDDPTHLSRPWTPQAFYRLACYFSCKPLLVGYVTSWKYRLLLPFALPFILITKNGKWLERFLWASFGWSCYLLLQKPHDAIGELQLNYYYPKNRG